MANDNLNTCASAVFDTFPMVMRAVKAGMHQDPDVALSMQQFRTLTFIRDHEGTHLSMLTDHIGQTVSAVSKLVDGLVERDFLERKTADDDRRKIMLRITSKGEEAIESVHQKALNTIQNVLLPLTETERSMVVLAMNALREALVAQHAMDIRKDV
ncbi:MAG: MarR family transcriptional regulator [Armatimonadota bacterium]